MKPKTCPVRLRCSTLKELKALSLTFDADGKPTESYDEIIRRGIAALKAQSQPARIDVSKL